jgi:hypothetical protein
MIRRNAIVAFMCVELMLNATNLALVTFSHMNGALDGQVAAFFVMVVAAAEVVVGFSDHRHHLPYSRLGLGRRREPAEVLKDCDAPTRDCHACAGDRHLHAGMAADRNPGREFGDLATGRPAC